MNPNPRCVSFNAAISTGYHTKSPSTLISKPANVRAYPTTRFSRAPGSNRACPLQAVYSDAQENPRWSPPPRRGGTGRGAQARWAPGWAEEAPCSTPDAITLPETRRVSWITAEMLPRLLPPLRPSLVACFLGSFPWRPAGGVGKSPPSQLNT